MNGETVTTRDRVWTLVTLGAVAVILLAFFDR